MLYFAQVRKSKTYDFNLWFSKSFTNNKNWFFLVASLYCFFVLSLVWLLNV